MKGFHDKAVTSKCSSNAATGTSSRSLTSDSSEPGSTDTKLFSKWPSLWSSFFESAFSVFETYCRSSSPPPPSSSSSTTSEKRKPLHTKHCNVWSSAVKKILAGGSMRRIQECVLGASKTGIPSTTSDIWLLGQCYKILPDESSGDAPATDALGAFTLDFTSRILMTYRKGFDTIKDSRLNSDVSWGCMLRTSQMLVAQALLFHQLGRSWRRSLDKPLDLEYIEILHLFRDAEASAFSIHNLLEAGKAYGLAAGSWVGPYAMCRSWESLARLTREETNLESQPLPMAVYVVSGDEDGNRGGAPVVCIEDASRHCLEFSKGQAEWTPILLLVPLVLGLDKINPRYVPSLRATFTFRQSIGILGGKPGASTYIVGVQDQNIFYLDPHEVQLVANINRDDVEADTSSYHCNVIRHIPLDLIDPSLAIGFYCRDKGDFDDFCSLASKLADKSKGAPLFTVAHSHKVSNSIDHDDMLNDSGEVRGDDSLDVMPMNDGEGGVHEEEWQLL